jgi:hypothetical protein
VPAHLSVSGCARVGLSLVVTRWLGVPVPVSGSFHATAARLAVLPLHRARTSIWAVEVVGLLYPAFCGRVPGDQDAPIEASAVAARLDRGHSTITRNPAVSRHPIVNQARAHSASLSNVFIVDPPTTG